MIILKLQKINTIEIIKDKWNFTLKISLDEFVFIEPNLGNTYYGFCNYVFGESQDTNFNYFIESIYEFLEDMIKWDKINGVS